ncbi:uncharacterized protein LOC135365857 [Ornithodoros turicata]|uniref:uncharacterized protein LOC135365857 n=1 Tax=Ornithodoros turicata TaxID=34597 RepID=UPI0031390FC3
MKLTFVAFVSCLLLGCRNTDGATCQQGKGGTRAPGSVHTVIVQPLPRFVAPKCEQRAFDVAVWGCRDIVSEAVDTRAETTGPAATAPPETARAWTDEQQKERCRDIKFFKTCLKTALQGKGCEANISAYLKVVKYKYGGKGCNTAARTTHPTWLLAALLFVVSTIKVAAFQ